MIPYEAATAISSGDEIHMKSKSLSGNLFRSRSALFGMKSHKGFTLIELLVVVAIIGILASVVLAALGSARGKATAAKAKSEMSQMRAQAEIYYLSNSNTYGSSVSGSSACTSEMFSTGTDNLSKLVESVLVFDSNLQCESTGTAWAVYSPSLAWCVDSDGYSDTATGQNAGVCTP